MPKSKPTGGQQKKSTGRKCSICTHAEKETINSQIATGESFRDISKQGEFSYSSVYRHAENCLGLTIGALIEQKKIEQAINVYEEFREQLAFAKDLRTASREYLSNPNDPLKLTIIPRADEIEVVYYDHDDTDKDGNPKKKSANLHALLQAIRSESEFEPDKVSIKHVDLRKFALDAINTTDTCIDKFAKIGGAYKQDAKNPTDNLAIARAVVQEMREKGFDGPEILSKAAERYGVQEHQLIG